MKKILAILLALSLMGCSTGEKIDQTPVERGTITDNVYLNESIDLRVDLPKTMRFASEEETQIFLELGGQVLDQNIEGYEQYVDFYAISKDYSSTIALTSIQRGKLDADQFLTFQEKQFKLLANDNVEVEILDKSELELAGKTWQVLNVSMKILGTNTRSAILVRAQNDKLLQLTLTATDESALESFLGYFQTADGEPLFPITEEENQVTEAGGLVDDVYVDELFNIQMELPKDMSFFPTTTEGTTMSTGASNNDGTKLIQIMVDNSMGLKAEQFIALAEQMFKYADSEEYGIETISTDDVEVAGSMWSSITMKLSDDEMAIYVVDAVKIESDKVMQILVMAQSEQEAKDLLQYITSIN